MNNGFFQLGSLIKEAPSSRLPKCGACQLFKKCQSPKMKVHGKGERGILVVGEAPGEEEDKAGRPFVGKSGKLLRDTLNRAGIDLDEDCWTTNALICRPPANKITDPMAVSYCRPNLLNTLEELEPKVVILLGATAVKSLMSHIYSSTDVGAITRWVGWGIPAHKINAWVFPTFHPSFVLRVEDKDPVVSQMFKDHLKAASKKKTKPWKAVPDYESQIQAYYDTETINEKLEEITDGHVAFDYECNMLKPESPKAGIWTCSICWNGTSTFAFPLTPAVRPSLIRLLQDRKVKKIACNAKYEDRFTKRILGVKVRPWFWDTLIAAHILDCRRNITSLKFQAFVRLGQPKYNGGGIDVLLNDGKGGGGNAVNRIKEIPMDRLLVYNGMDSLLEYLVAESQIREMGDMDSIYEGELP